MEIIDSLWKVSRSESSDPGRCQVLDRRARTWRWAAGNIVLVGFWAISARLERATALRLIVLVAWSTFNLTMSVRAFGQQGNPVAVATDSKLFLRVISNAWTSRYIPGLNPLQYFVSLDASQIKTLCGWEVEIRFPGSHRRRGIWMVIYVDSRTEAEMLQALGTLPNQPGALWLVTCGDMGQTFFRWDTTFDPAIKEWLEHLSRRWSFVDTEVKRVTLDLATFSSMNTEEQKASVRKLVELGLRPAALMMVKTEKKLSIEDAARFMKEASDRPPGKG